MIIKYPFWRMTTLNKNAFYVCINFGEAVTPPEIADRSLCINADIGEVFLYTKTLFPSKKAAF